MKPSFFFRATAGSFLATTVALHLALVAPASAASFTWSGGGGNGTFSNPGNWVGGVAPTAATTNDFIFTGSSQLAPTITGNSSYFTGNITFDSSAGAFVIGPFNGQSVNRFTINTASSSISQLSSNNQVIDATVFLQNNLTVTGNGAGSLALNSLRFSSTGSSLIAGRSVTFNTIANSGATSVNIRAYNASANSPQVVTFSGTDTGALTNLILNSSVNGNAGSPSGSNSGATVQASNAGGLTSNASILGNDMTFGGNRSMAFSGGITLYGNADKTVTFNNTGGTTIAGTAQFGTISANGSRAVNLTVNSGATTTFTANLTGSSSTGTTSIAKNGVGTLVLSGTSNINGTTTVSAGTLLINGDQSSATGAVSVSGSASLGGNGTIGGATTIANNGILTPGTNEDSTTTLTLNTKNLTLSGVDTKVNMDITGAGTGAFDSIAGINVFALNGDLTFNLTGTYTNTSWNVFGFQSKSGNFDTVTLAGSYSVTLSRIGDVWSGTGGWQFDQTTGALSVVPEPSAWILATIGLTTVMVFRRRRKSI